MKRSGNSFRSTTSDSETINTIIKVLNDEDDSLPQTAHKEIEIELLYNIYLQIAFCIRGRTPDNNPFSTPSPTFSLRRIFRILGLDKSLSANA